MGRTGLIYKLRLFLLFCVVYSLCYLLPNFRPHWPPLMLPLLAIDSHVPLVPWTFVIYLSDYLLIFLAICMHESDKFQSYSRMCFATVIFCGLFFLFYPTTYPRPIYPQISNAFVRFFMDLVRGADTPNNCFPSMHVAMTAMTAWSLRYKGKTISFFFALWAFAVFVSTLTTKQHYFVDIVGGLGVMLATVYLEWLLFQKKTLRLWFPKAFH